MWFPGGAPPCGNADAAPQECSEMTCEDQVWQLAIAPQRSESTVMVTTRPQVSQQHNELHEHGDYKA